MPQHCRSPDECPLDGHALTGMEATAIQGSYSTHHTTASFLAISRSFVCEHTLRFERNWAEKDVARSGGIPFQISEQMSYVCPLHSAPPRDLEHGIY
jgi:hypothetical protein